MSENRNTGNFQASSKPYALITQTPESGSAMLHIEFPNITKFITIQNIIPATEASNQIVFGFSSGCMDSGEYIILNNSERYTYNVAIQNLYLSSLGASFSSGSILAGLTTITK